MNHNETLAFIAKYIDECKEKDRLNIVEKPDRMNQHVTHHFMNIFTDAIFLFLHDLKLMPNSTTGICTYFQQSIKTDCMLLRKHLADVDQYYIWMYKLINHMMNEKFALRDYSDSLEQIIQFEKLVEEELVLPNSDSVISQITNYKLIYADFVYKNDKKDYLINFVNELVEDDKQYPFLEFFNVTNIHSIDIIDHFYNKLQLQPNYKIKYPLTTIILKRFSDYQNIQYLYPIVKFINYLMQQFNHRIKRADANMKTIADCLKNNSNLESIYKEFLDAWYSITLTEIQKQRPQTRHTFEKFNISMFLLNKSNSDEDMIVAANIGSKIKETLVFLE
jgi:hypothetical protein